MSVPLAARVRAAGRHLRPAAGAGLALAVLLLSPGVEATTPASGGAAERARWRALLGWSDECEQAHRQAQTALELDQARIELFELGGRRQWVAVGCAWGSYQGSWLLYVVDHNQAPPRVRAVSLPGYRFDDASEQWQPQRWNEPVGELSFERGGAFTLLTRARGLGDCGTFARYRLQGATAVLAEFRARDCDGDPEEAPPPSRWPTVSPR